jgi:hypothetical protein
MRPTMKRRGFLQLLGFGAANAVSPQILNSKQIVTKEVTFAAEVMPEIFDHAADAFSYCNPISAQLWSARLREEVLKTCGLPEIMLGHHDYGRELTIATPANYPCLSDEQPHDSPEDS